jgi:methionine-rich copper-binding protein CopC
MAEAMAAVTWPRLRAGTVLEEKIMKLRNLLLSLVLAAPVAALAHAHLEKSAPADKSRVEKVEKLELTFTEEVQLTAVTLQRAGAAARPISPLPVESASGFTLPVQGLAAGDYTVTWSVATDDGHVATGKVRFTLAPPAARPH